MKKLIVPLCCALVLTGCADVVSAAEAANRAPVGFWYGLWHGVVSPFAFFGWMFSDSIALYASYNNGWPYWIGYFLGFTSWLGGGYEASSR